MITKRQLIAHFKSQVAIADLLGITKQAVNNWPMDDPIPELQEMRLRYELASDVFPPTPSSSTFPVPQPAGEDAA